MYGTDSLAEESQKTDLIYLYGSNNLLLMKNTEQPNEKKWRLAVYWILNPSKTTISPHILGIVDRLFAEMVSTEGVCTSKKGKLRRDLVDHLRVILCNLLNAYETDPNLYIAHHRNRNKYKKVRPYRGFQFGYGNTVKVVNFLRDKEYIEWHKGYRALGPKKVGQLSKMKANSKLVELFVDRPQTDLPGIYRDDSHKESVIVKGKKIYYAVIDDQGSKRKVHKRHKVKTPNKPIVRQIKKNLDTINRVIECCCIELDMDQHELEALNRQLSIDPNKHTWPIDFTRKRLYRAFVDRSLELHGLFYGGWWENVPEDYRERILINERPTVELDLATLMPHILYALEKAPFPDKDPYCLPWPEETQISLGPLVKKILLIGLNAKNESGAVSALREKYKREQERARLRGNTILEPPIKITVENLYPIFNQMLDQHAAIQHYFFSGQGNMLAYHVSQIAEEVMLCFARRGTPCLPVYDSLIVNIRRLDECWETIRRSFYSHFGQKIPVNHIGLVTTP